MKRWLIQIAAYCIAGGAVFIAVGMEWWRAVVIAACAFAMLASMRWWPNGWYTPWPRERKRVYGGGTHQVSNLAARIDSHRGRRREPDPSLQRRLRTLALAKVARLDYTWDDDDAHIKAALGPHVYDALRAETFNPDIATVERIVAAIENIGAAKSGARDERSDERDQQPRQHTQ